MTRSLLFSPIQLREVVLRNRTVVSPMCQYSAHDGFANDWHFVHLGQFAMGGFGLVFIEASAVVPEGRITHGDLGLWSDEHIVPVRRIADYVHGQGARLGIQLAHQGRKASTQRPWFGNAVLGPADRCSRRRAVDHRRSRGDAAQTKGGLSRELSTSAASRTSWRRSALRPGARSGRGTDVVEMHGCARLPHPFVPLPGVQHAQRRVLEATSRAACEWHSSRAIRPRCVALWQSRSSSHCPPSTAWIGGWSLDDTGRAREGAEAIGVDVVDCSAGGFLSSRLDVQKGYLVPNASRVRRDAGVATQAVGFIVDARQAEHVLRSGAADLVAIAREALVDPHWAARLPSSSTARRLGAVACAIRLVAYAPRRADEEVLTGRRVAVDQPQRFQLAPERCRNGRPAVPEIGDGFLGAAHARHDARDRRVMQRELDGGRGKRDAVPRAHGLDATRALLDVGVGFHIEERGAIARTGGEDARVEPVPP
jgi:2,4-dienoyl-CoA reductase-like NADH-dependent reductase (Old Yellow Enzyme family)